MGEANPYLNVAPCEYEQALQKMYEFNLAIWKPRVTGTIHKLGTMMPPGTSALVFRQRCGSEMFGGAGLI